MNKLKIICTLGPSSSDFNVLSEMLLSSMDMVRLNTAHGQLEDHLDLLSLVSSVERDSGKMIPRILDLKGIDLRLGTFGGELLFEKGESFWLVPQDESSIEKYWIPFSHPQFLNKVSPGEMVRLDSGCLTCEVMDTQLDRIHLRVKNRWRISERKGVTLSSFAGTHKLALTERDRNALELCLHERVDWIALSFVNHHSQVRELRDELNTRGLTSIRIMSKIETSYGIDKLNSILDESDGVMFARGDLGVQVEIHKLPSIQKRFFYQSNLKGLPSVLATQLLSSMCNRPIPNRSEVTDVFNGVLDGARWFMLSEESASGEFPVESVVLLRKLIEEGEQFIKEKDLVN
ncbi:pyruvate kinase [Candidatus Similichlamydia epinepheli]|uniref:pyruvate kinase n=1 Tax=Candidatus Similichlamydia epinepheli TaxID=1903953 RepID=UPI000D36336E|nr:pyruvate kinase [Candidatus Similichlamydia epinepheli]